MATKPTRQQQQACDHLAEALLLISEAARLDGRATLDRDAFGEVARLAVRATSAFGLDEVVARALERRAKNLGLPSGTAELLTLLESDVRPLETLLLADDEFKALVETMQEALDDV